MNPRFYTDDIATEHYLGIRWPLAIWRAVLAQAIEDARNGPSLYEMKGLSLQEMVHMRNEYQVAARCWIDDDANEPRRFVWVCELLGLDPDAVRKAI